VCVLGCGHTVSPSLPASPPAAVSVVLAGPAVAADSLRVAATDSFGVDLASHLAAGAEVSVVTDRRALDFIDGGGDVLVTDRASVIRYASSRADYATIALPWDRQYAFVSVSQLPIENVVDAVHADARPAAERCPVTVIERTLTPARVLYPASDSIARSLAERLVGLNLAQRAAPIGRDALSDTTVSAYIVARPIDSASCDIGALHAVPLVDTRSHLIVRRGAVGVVADTTGRIRLEIAP